jgi:hypothetical protein
MNTSPAAVASAPAPQPRPSARVRAAMLGVAFGAICAEVAIAAGGLGLLAPSSLRLLEDPPFASLLLTHSWSPSLLQARPSLSSLLLLHLAVSGVLVGVAAMLYRRGARHPIFLLLAVSTTALGPLGAAGTALAAVLHRVFLRRATPFEQWYAALFPVMDPSPARELYGRLALRGGAPGTRSSVASFSDVIALGTVRHKQAVLTMIVDEFRPAFAPALRGALNDAEPAVRVQAATASARIENRFLERAMALEERRAAAPDDPDVLLALARHHDEYANTGLLDTGRAQAERRQALECYERVARLRPGDPEVAQAAGRLLVRLGQPARAVEHLGPLADSGQASPEVLAWYLECLYRLCRVDLLRRAARLHGGRIAASGLPSEVRDAAQLWTEDSAPPVPAAERAA